MRRTLALTAVLVAAALVPATASGADQWFTVPLSDPRPAGSGDPDVAYGDASFDGSVVVFNTSEALVPEDTDTLQDVYERRGAQLRLVSVAEDGAPGGPAGFVGLSDDGSTVVFSSPADFTSVASQDGDDLFMRRDGVTTLITPSERDLLIRQGLDRVWISDDGSHVAFNTEDALLAADRQPPFSGRTDGYEWTDGELRLITRGGPGDQAAAVVALSADGERAFVETRNAYDATDTDAENDVYVVEDGATALLTEGTTESIGVRAIARDGSRAYFVTPEALLPADTDTVDDVYGRGPGEPFSLVSNGPLRSDTADPADLQAVDETGDAVAFTTRERLTDDDTDAGTAASGPEDIYLRRDDATTTLESTATTEDSRYVSGLYTFAQLNRAGSQLWWFTRQALLDDTEPFQDVYRRAAGATARESVAEDAAVDQGPYDASFGGAAQDGSRTFFVTQGRFTAADTDAADDVYARSAGATSLVTPDPLAPCAGGALCDPAVRGWSADGARLRFTTLERLTPGDTDESLDLYESRLVVAPVLATGSAPVPVAEQGAGQPVFADLSVTEPYDDVFSATVTIAAGAGPGDRLAYPGTGPVAGTVSADGRTVTLTGRATRTQYRDALRSVTFAHDGDAPSAAPRTVTATLSNGGATSAPVTRSVTVTLTDDPPVVGADGTVAYPENGTGRRAAPALELSDPDSATLAGATVQIASGHAAGEDVLELPQTAGIDAAFSDGTLTLTGAAPVEAYEAALRSVRYRNTSDAPSEAERVLAWRAADASAGSEPATTRVEVLAVDDPVAVGLAAEPLDGTADAAGVALDPAATVTDPDTGALEALVVRFAGGARAGERLLGGAAGPVAARDDGAGGLVLAGPAPPEAFAAALRTVRVVSGTSGVRVVEVATDGQVGARRAVLTAPAVPGTPAARPRSRPLIGGAGALRVRGGSAVVRCRAPELRLRRCDVVLRRGGRTLGRGSARAVGDGRPRLAVRVRVSRAGRRALRRQGRLRVRVVARAVAADGRRLPRGGEVRVLRR